MKKKNTCGRRRKLYMPTNLVGLQNRMDKVMAQVQKVKTQQLHSNEVCSNYISPAGLF